MYKRLNELNFVIGLFFTIVSLILLVGSFLSRELSGRINIYTGIVFLIFGVFMIMIKRKDDDSN
jgi:putative Ca2+/H+ antiporter (TMEM165/GDT1 family)